MVLMKPVKSRATKITPTQHILFKPSSSPDIPIIRVTLKGINRYRRDSVSSTIQPVDTERKQKETISKGA